MRFEDSPSPQPQDRGKGVIWLVYATSTAAAQRPVELQRQAVQQAQAELPEPLVLPELRVLREQPAWATRREPGAGQAS